MATNPDTVAGTGTETTPIDERLHWNAGVVGGSVSAPPLSPAYPVRDRKDRADPQPRVEAGIRHRRKPAASRIRKPVHALLGAAMAREHELGIGFLLLPVALGAGVCLYWALPVEPAPHNVPAGLAAAALGVLLTARAGFHAVVRAGFLLLLVVLAGMAVAQWRTHTLSTEMLGSAVNTTLKGRIVKIETRANGSVRHTIDILSTARPSLRYAPERVRVTSRAPIAGVTIGTVVEGRARLMPPSGPARPRGYDFAFHAYFQKIGANGFFFGPPDIVASAEAAPVRQQPALALQRARVWLSSRIRNSAPGPAGAVSSALVTGDKSPIPEDVTDILRLSGLAHILSISGLHMALVAGTVMFAIRALLALAPGWSSKRPVKKHAAIAAFVFITAYLFLAGASVATQRSFVMLAVMLCALLTDRAAITMRNLAIAAIVVIMLTPEAVAGPGFQMSFAATAALIAAYRYWNDRRSASRSGFAFAGRSGSLPSTLMRGAAIYLIAVIVTSVVAGAATGIYSAYHFQRVPPFGLLANLLAVPIVSLITMPLAIIGVILIPFGLDGPAFQLMGVSVDWVMAVAAWVVSISPNQVTGAMPLAAMLTATAALIAMCLLQTPLRLAGVGLFAASALFWARDTSPIAYLSEDGRQLAIVGKEGKGRSLHANRARPNSFLYEQWLTASGAHQIVKPKDSAVMACGERGCIARAEATNGRPYTIRYVDADAAAAIRAADGTMTELCQGSDLVILAYAPSALSCGADTIVVTAKMLAINGAAAIMPASSGMPSLSGTPASATDAPTAALRPVFATPGTNRPWHEARRYSRPARNLTPWQARKPAPAGKTAQ